MENLKNYNQFRINEAESLLDILTGGGEKSDKTQIGSKDTNTQELLSEIVEKIKSGDTNPIYVFNTVNIDESFYITGEVFNEAEILGFDKDPQDGLLITNKGKYSYCILNCTKVNSDLEIIKDQLRQLMGKNQASGIKTMIEVTNISFLDTNSMKGLSELISSRKINGVSLTDGDFFILTDNNNSKKGGKNLTKSIAEYFSKTPISIYNHFSSLNSEESE